MTNYIAPIESWKTLEVGKSCSGGVQINDSNANSQPDVLVLSVAAAQDTVELNANASQDAESANERAPQ